jgi:hypothetical protein
MTSLVRNEIITIDDFYPDPYAVRAQGLASTYREDGWSNEISLPEGSRGRLEELLGVTIVAWPVESGNGGFLLATKERGAKGIHTDGPRYSVGITVYMTPDEMVPSDLSLEDAGTLFWQHAHTEFFRLPTNRDLKSQRLSRGKWERAEKSPRGWVTIDRVPYHFNRAAIFPVDLYHSTARGFGNDVQDGRLVHSYLFGIKPTA